MPSRRERASKAKITSTVIDDLSDIFSFNVFVREVSPNMTFNVSSPALIEISRQTYSLLLTEHTFLYKQLLPEYLDYYSTAMLWFRMLTLKRRNRQSVNEIEEAILYRIQFSTFCVPEPIMLQLQIIGNITTMTGQHLYPSFPVYPSQQLNGHGGYYGALLVPQPPPAAPVDLTIHNLYEEIPCPGVLASAVRAAVSDLKPGPYQSDVTYENQQPTANLLGFKPLGFRREEAKNLALGHGITDQLFEESPANSGINFKFLLAISHLLATTKTFKNNHVVFSTMPEAGDVSQTIIERPYLDGDNTNQIALNGEMQATSLTRERSGIFEAGIFFCPQLLKEGINGINLSWSLFLEIPKEWIDNRNDRRNIPIQYHQNQFSVTDHASNIRTDVLRSMQKANC